MRRFWLTSDYDDDFTIDLMDRDAFGANPSGLGGSIDTDTIVMGTDVIPSNYKPSYDAISFDLVTGAESEDPYEAYRMFIQALSMDGLVLNYSYDEMKTVYKRDVMVSSVEKGEIDHEVNWLVSNIEFKPLSPWYQWLECTVDDADMEFEDDSNWLHTKIFNKGNDDHLVIPYVYGPNVSVLRNLHTKVALLPIDTSNCVHFMPDQTVPIIISYIIKETVDVFEIRLFDSDMGLLENVIFTTHFEEGTRIDISSDFKDLFATATIEGGSDISRDILPYLTTSTSGFLRVESGTVCYISFGKQGFDPRTDSVIFREECIVI